MRFFLLIILFVVSLFAHESNAKPREGRILLIADFDTGKKSSSIGGDFGSWVSNPHDLTQTCVDSFTNDVRHGAGGYALRVFYDVDSPNPAFNGIWFKLNGADFSHYSKLIFWVKGDRIRGYTKVFKVELKNSKGDIGSYYVSSVAADWSKVEIPLSAFNLKDYSSMKELVFVFEDKKATKKEGVLYFDDIYLK